LLPFLLFLAVLVYGFKYLGRARHAAGKDKKTALFMWALGSALFANAVAFFGISYYDQTMVAWYALLAMIPAAISVRPKHEVASPQPLEGFQDDTKLVAQLAGQPEYVDSI
jgi:hypothetical protein